MSLDPRTEAPHSSANYAGSDNDNPEKHAEVEATATSLSNSNDLVVFDISDPNDTRNPQNWSETRKHLLFFALMSSSILTDGGMVWGATLIVPQALEWNIAITHSATSLNYGILLQGIGGILAIPLIEAYGRLPLWFWPQIVTMGVVIGCCFAQDWSTFTALRSLQGLFGTIPQVIGLPIIHDMYAPKDWPRMINIWGTTFLVGPFLGPALAGYLLQGTGSWQGSFKVLAGFYGFSSILILAFGRETFYMKGNHTQENSRVEAFFGIGNTNVAKGSTIMASFKNLFIYIFKLPLLLCGIATMINFFWPIGITTTVDAFIRAPPYLLNNVQDASMRFAGVIGALSGFVFGYFFNGWIFKSARRSHWRPEYRLHGVWFPIGTMAIGLVIYGLCLQFHKSWVGIAFGWGMVVFGMIASTVAITAFALEKYPTQSTVVSAIINMWRTTGGFSVGYFQPSWIAKDGVGVVFGIQAAIVSVCIVLTITPVIILGRRHAQGKVLSA